jgi:hypothetical protein
MVASVTGWKVQFIDDSFADPGLDIHQEFAARFMLPSPTPFAANGDLPSTDIAIFLPLCSTMRAAPENWVTQYSPTASPGQLCQRFMPNVYPVSFLNSSTIGWL